jgi:hypothetical protein
VVLGASLLAAAATVVAVMIAVVPGGRVEAGESVAIHGAVWEESVQVDGEWTDGEGAPTASISLSLYQETEDDWLPIDTVAMGNDGTYEFPGLSAGEYWVCLDVDPAYDWTLTKVKINGSDSDTSNTPDRCVPVTADGEEVVNWGVVHMASKFEFSKECDSEDLASEEITCTLTVANVGETILYSRDVWDYYGLDGLEVVSSDPPTGDMWQEEGEGGLDWDDLPDLAPGESEQYEVTMAPVAGAESAYNCVGGAAWNVRVPLGDDRYYDAWWDDIIVDEGDCVELVAAPSPTPTPTPSPTATPTVLAAQQLPTAGGQPPAEGGFTWLAAGLGALLAASGATFLVLRARRV